MVVDTSRITADNAGKLQREGCESIMVSTTTDYKDYKGYKQSLDFELQRQAESFVRVGYLLKVARDTNILAESGYKSVAEFAQAEYGLSKDVVSRYIAINDRYSEGGYSDHLLIKYEGYGYAKLTEMLTIPDEIASEIEPSITRKEIQDIKKEIAKEEEISPMEVAMEAAEEKNIEERKSYSESERVWLEYYRTAKKEFIDIKPAVENEDEKQLMDILAPYGTTVKWARVPGVGKMMIAISGPEQTATITNIRTFEKIKVSAGEILADLISIFGKMITKRTWEKVYGEPFENAPAKTGIKPHETAENDIKTKENVIKTEENVIKAAEPDEEGTDEGDEENNEKPKAEKKAEGDAPEKEAVKEAPAPEKEVKPVVITATEEQIQEFKEQIEKNPVAGFIEVAPVQQPETDTHRIIEVREEIDLYRYDMSEEMPPVLRRRITMDALTECIKSLQRDSGIFKVAAENIDVSADITLNLDIKAVSGLLDKMNNTMNEIEKLFYYHKQIMQELMEAGDDEE